MPREGREKERFTKKGKKRGLPQKSKKKHNKNASDLEEPAAKKAKKDSKDPEFSYVRFKFLLRSPETVMTGLQTFLDICGDEEDGDDGKEGLKLLESYLRSSPECSEVMDLLTPKASSQEISLLFAWLKIMLEKCPRATTAHSELQRGVVHTLLTRHTHLIMNSLRKGNKTKHVKSTLMLLLTIASLGYKFAKLLHLHLDFNHTNWPGLLSQRNRKDEIDIRVCMIAILMTLLQVEDEELTKMLVEQKGLLQEVLTGLKYDRSEYVIHSLNTIHRCIVMNANVGKNSKMYLFNSHVLKELLTLYQWPGPSQWRSQPTEDEKKEYTEEQQKVAEWVDPMLTDLLTNHKLGICYRDRSYGMSNENKNPIISKVLQLLVTSYSSPLSHQLVTAILKACPDQTATFLKLLQPHLFPRPIDTWITCLRFFLRIIESHEWPSGITENTEGMTEEKASQVVHFLFPQESIINSFKEGLKNACATVRHECLHALEVIAIKGRHFCQISKDKLGHQAPLTLGIEGFVSKSLPNGQILLNLLQKFCAMDSFAVSITRDMYKDKDVPLPHVSRFQLLVAILRMYSLAPEHLTGGPADTLPSLLQIVADVVASDDEIDAPPEGTPHNMPSLHLLHALSECDAKKLNLFGKGGNKGDPKSGLVYQLICLMQAQSDDDTYMELANSLIVKLLTGTGLFDNHKGELAIWLRHLQSADLAPEEVVMFFVGLLRQYMSNPYPAIDRVLDIVEESPQMVVGSASSIRQEFSPLVMFALDGDFHQHKKVHQYVCSVLIDILHALHNPSGFSRLVHSLSDNLDPEVTLYLTLHNADEKMMSQSLAKRLCKKLRLKQLKSFKHGSVAVMKKLLMGEREVEDIVEDLSISSCLPLIQLCLRYLDELVFASVKSKAELLNKQLAETCVETLRAICDHLSKTTTATTTSDGSTTTDSTTTTGSKSDEASEKNIVELSISDLSHLKTNGFQQAVTYILSHPVVSQWLFVDGFKQGGTPREHIVTELCDIIQSVYASSLNIEVEPLFDVGSKCHHMLQMASESAKTRTIPGSVQPLLCRCLESLFTVGGQKGKAEGLLTLVCLPADNFTTSASQTSSPLAETVCRLASQLQLDDEMLKDLSSGLNFATSLDGLFGVASVMDSSSLDCLALSFVQCDPELCSACSVVSFQGMLKRLEEKESSDLLWLLECLMTHSRQCRSACGLWLVKKKKQLKEGKQVLYSIMLLYLRLLLTTEDSASDDVGVQAIAQVMCHKMDDSHLSMDQLEPAFLHIVCHLINFAMIEKSLIDKIQNSLLTMLEEKSKLHKAHVQLLAATVRQQSLRACDLQQEGDDLRKEKMWNMFEKEAGQVLLACLRYLTGSQTRTRNNDPSQESCNGCMVRLCQDLLCLTIDPDVKAAIMTFWTDMVTCCLKYHYKDAQYISLLRQLVSKVYAQEEQTATDDDVLDDDEEEEEENKDISEKTAEDNSSNEDSSAEDDEDEGVIPPAKHRGVNSQSASSTKKPPARQQSFKSLSTLVMESAKHLKLSKKSDVAKKCVALFSEEVDHSPTNARSEIVSRWTGSALKHFFLWSYQPTAVSPDMKMTLGSPDGSVLMDLCEKIVGHTAFLIVLQEEEHEKVRSELVDLLACLVRLHKTCCSALPVNALLAAYGATLSLTDQNLLFLMFACDLYGNQRFNLGLWGEKAVKQLETKKQLGRSLLIETKLDDILELLDPDTMATSILHFPLMRSMEFHLSEYAVKAERMMSREDCYDPRFLLQVFYHFLGPEHVVNIRSFISHKGLGFALAALSSHDVATRQLAIGILANVYSHAESTAPLLVAFLKSVKNGITKECQKLPCILTVFLAKAADLIVTPESDLYVTIHSFMMLKPALDVNNVPEFYHFFNSSRPKERAWILQLLQEGLRETNDHRLFQRRFVYKMLTSYANSSLSDPQTRRNSLKVLVKACTIPTVVRDLVTKHGLLPWLAAFIKDTLSDLPEVHLVCQLIHNVYYTPLFNRQRLWWLSLPRLSRQCLLHTPLMVCVQLLLQSFSHLEEKSLEMLEDICKHPHFTSSTTPTLLPHVPH